MVCSTGPSSNFLTVMHANLQTEHLRQADPEMAAAVERAMAGRAGDGGGAGGLLPEGLITAEPEAAATPLQPTPTEVRPSCVTCISHVRTSNLSLASEMATGCARVEFPTLSCIGTPCQMPYLVVDAHKVQGCSIVAPPVRLALGCMLTCMEGPDIHPSGGQAAWEPHTAVTAAAFLLPSCLVIC
jgi:hypothetical protein